MKTSIIAEQTGLETGMLTNYWQALCNQGMSTFGESATLTQALDL